MDHPGTPIPHDGWTALHNLSAAASMLRYVDAESARLRVLRNQRIMQALSEGSTEREVAETAGVSASYVHRVRAYAGAPPSGPILDAERRRTS